MEISAQTVKELRERTGAGIMDCRKALTEAEGDLSRAEAILAQKGAQKMAGRVRETKQGLVESYKHPGGQLGALVELNCETDFVSRTEGFQQLAYEIALHVAATNPRYVDRESIPQVEIEGQRAAFADQLQLAGTAAADLDRALEARLEQWVQEVALLDQPYVRDPKNTIRELIAGIAAKTGEDIRIGRFARFKIGE
jgi:elongation factor Ts